MASTGFARTAPRTDSPSFGSTDLFRDTLLQLGREDSMEDMPPLSLRPTPAVHEVTIAARELRPRRCSPCTASVTIAGIVGLAVGTTGGWYVGGAGGAVFGAVANVTALTVALLISRLCCAREQP